MDLSFQWLTTLSRYAEGRLDIQYTNILELVSEIAVNCLPIIKTISENQIQEIIDNMAHFLKAFTHKSLNTKDEIKNNQKFESGSLYSGFIVDYLLKSQSQKTFYLGLSILKNILLLSKSDIAKIVV